MLKMAGGWRSPRDGRLAGEESGSAFLFQGDWNKEREPGENPLGQEVFDSGLQGSVKLFYASIFLSEDERKAVDFLFFRGLNENDAREWLGPETNGIAACIERRGQRMDGI